MASAGTGSSGDGAGQAGHADQASQAGESGAVGNSGTTAPGRGATLGDSAGDSGSKRSRPRAAEDGESASSSSTRQKLVEAAQQLFLVRGYEATGVSEILREAGVNSGSLYYFFKTKEHLLLAVLDWYLDGLFPFVMQPAFDKTDDPIERVFAVLGGYREMLAMTDCRQGCPIGNLALEMCEKSEAVRAKIALNFENWRVAIRQCLVDAGDRLPGNLDRDKMATFILTVMEGGVMQAKARRSLEPFDACVTMLRDYFDRLGVEAIADATR